MQLKWCRQSGGIELAVAVTSDCTNLSSGCAIVKDVAMLVGGIAATVYQETLDAIRWRGSPRGELCVNDRKNGATLHQLPLWSTLSTGTGPEVWASNCSPEKVFRAEVRRNGAPCSISRRHLKGCVKVCSTWALVDGLILGRQAAWRPGTIVVVSSWCCWHCAGESE